MSLWRPSHPPSRSSQTIQRRGEVSRGETRCPIQSLTQTPKPPSPSTNPSGTFCHITSRSGEVVEDPAEAEVARARPAALPPVPARQAHLDLPAAAVPGLVREIPGQLGESMFPFSAHLSSLRLTLHSYPVPPRTSPPPTAVDATTVAAQHPPIAPAAAPLVASSPSRSREASPAPPSFSPVSGSTAPTLILTRTRTRSTTGAILRSPTIKTRRCPSSACARCTTPAGATTIRTTRRISIT